MQIFDLSGTLRRIRRLTDLSQRELAERCGLSQSAIAQAESGRRDLPAGALARAAALAGLRLALVDEGGGAIDPMAPDAVRDHGRRLFPAHLDTRRSDQAHWLHEPRRDRPETWFTYTRDRRGRDAVRLKTGTPADHHPFSPGDSPPERAAARRRIAREKADAEFRRRLAAGEVPALEPFDCTCPAACDELDDRSAKPVHDPACACDCDVA